MLLGVHDSLDATLTHRFHKGAAAAPPSSVMNCRRLTRSPRPRARAGCSEGAPLHLRDHSITSSARASSVAGTSRPSALALLRLITRSYLVGACTGRWEGFSPLRMRST